MIIFCNSSAGQPFTKEDEGDVATKDNNEIFRTYPSPFRQRMTLEKWYWRGRNEGTGPQQTDFYGGKDEWRGRKPVGNGHERMGGWYLHPHPEGQRFHVQKEGSQSFWIRISELFRLLVGNEKSRNEDSGIFLCLA